MKRELIDTQIQHNTAQLKWTVWCGEGARKRRAWLLMYWLGKYGSHWWQTVDSQLILHDHYLPCVRSGERCKDVFIYTLLFQRFEWILKFFLRKCWGFRRLLLKLLKSFWSATSMCYQHKANSQFSLFKGTLHYTVGSVLQYVLCGSVLK